MNETKPPSSANRTSNLPAAHITTNNTINGGLPNACSASTSQQQQQQQLNHHPSTTYSTPIKNDLKAIQQQQQQQPQTPQQQQQQQQYKTVQLISRNNHLVSNSQAANCVVLQHVPGGNNQALGFAQLSSPEHSQQNPQGGPQQQQQTIYRQQQKGGQTTFVSSRPQQQHQQHPNQIINANNFNQNGDGSVGGNNAIQQQTTQIPARYAQIHQLQDGRQVQMIQIPNHQYVQLSNAPGGGQNGQPQQIMTYVHSQQQPPPQFVTTTARNGGGGGGQPTQNVIIASQAQDGSQTTLSVPAQIIQHTVSPQNASFHLTKSSLKNVKSLHTNTQQPQQLQQQQRQEIIHISNNGTQSSAASNQSQMQQQQQPNSEQSSQPQSSSSQASPKGKGRSKTTPNKNVKPRTVVKSSPQTQQVTNHSGQPTATIQQIALPQIRMQTPKGQDKSGSVGGGFAMYPRGTPAGTSIIQIQSAGQMQTQNQDSVFQHQQHQTQIIQQQQQQLPANAVLHTVQKKIIIQNRETPQAVLNINQSIASQQQPQLHIPSSSKIQTLVMNTSDKALAAGPSTSAVVAAKTRTIKPSSSTAAANAISPIPNDPFSGVASKLNLDLTGGDPKESYRTLKKHFKFLVYENECYQGQLRDFHQRLLKLERDNNYLMDRLLKYETMSDSDGDESDSSTKTIEDKIVINKPPKKRPANRNTSAAPARKRASVVAKPPTTSNSNSVPPPASKTSNQPAASKPTSSSSSKPVAKPPSSLKDSPVSSKTSFSLPSSNNNINNNTSNNESTSTSSTLAVFQTNMPLPSVYKPFPSSNTSTTPSTPTTDVPFVTPEVPKSPMIAKKQPQPPVSKATTQLKAKVTIADLPKVEKPVGVGFHQNVLNSPTTSGPSGPLSDVSGSGNKTTTTYRFPTPPRNPTPQSNATVTYTNLKPNAAMIQQHQQQHQRPSMQPNNAAAARIVSSNAPPNGPRVRLISKPPPPNQQHQHQQQPSVKPPQQFVQKQ